MQIEFRVIPNAPRTAIDGLRDGNPVLRVNAPARDGKANRAAIEYLARCLGIAKSRVQIVSGEKSRHKKFEIVGWDSDQQESLLADLLKDDL